MPTKMGSDPRAQRITRLGRKVLLLLVGVCVAAGAATQALGERSPEDGSRARELLDRVSSGGAALSDEELALVLSALPTDVVRSDLVMTAAQVFDRRGRPVLGLKAEDFRIFEEGQAREITWFREEDEGPLSLLVAVDASGSMGWGKKRERIREALLPLMRRIRHRDRVLFVTFADGEMRGQGRWNNRPMTTLREILDAPKEGRTALADALKTSAEFMTPDILGRRGIILITDGLDNASSMTPAEAVRASQAIDVPVYILALGGIDREIQARRQPQGPIAALRRAAEATGGRFFLVGTEAQAQAAARRLDQDLRHQYWLAFPPNRPPDGRSRTIDVKTTDRGYRVRARRGYR